MSAPSLHTAVQTRFSDLDPLGHVNNAAFFSFMETARLSFLRRYALMPVLVARGECDYRAEIGAGVRTVDVTVQAESVGRTSFTLRHDLEVDGAPVATGRTVMVKTDEARRPTPLTDAERAALLGT